MFSEDLTDIEFYYAIILQVEGILQNSEGGVDIEKIDNFEVPPLNTFEKSQPLDDLLIRRRSLHSSPANSRFVVLVLLIVLNSTCNRM